MLAKVGGQRSNARRVLAQPVGGSMRNSKKLALVGVLGAVAGAANAAVPAGAEAVFTGLATDFAVIAGYGFTAMAAITGGLLVFGLVKKVARKSV